MSVNSCDLVIPNKNQTKIMAAGACAQLAGVVITVSQVASLTFSLISGYAVTGAFVGCFVGQDIFNFGVNLCNSSKEKKVEKIAYNFLFNKDSINSEWVHILNKATTNTYIPRSIFQVTSAVVFISQKLCEELFNHIIARKRT